MSQALVNELNKMQEVLGQNMNVLKQSQATLSGNENAANFDRIFDKQLRKEDPTIDKIKTTSENVSNEVVEDVKGAINEVEKAVKGADSSIKLDKYTKENSDIKEKVDGLDSAQAKKDVKSELSLIEQLAEIRDLLEQVTSEANVENSLDLTLTKNIEDFISQLKDYCRPITDNNIGQNIWGLEIESDSKTEINQDVLNEILEKISALLDSDSKQELKLELPNLFEQVLTYIDNKDVSLKQDTKVVETLLESKEAILENSSEMIRQDETVDIFTENDTLELQVNTELQKTGEQELILDEEMLKELSIESVSSETYASSGDGESLLQGQTPQEQGVRVMIDQQLESFELKIDKAMNAHMPAQQVQPKSVEVNPGRIIEQVAKQMEALQNNSKVSIVLNPESLGKVNIQLMSTKEGLTAQIMVTSQEAKDLLMKGLDGLKESLLSHGVGVDNVSVKLNDVQKGTYNSDWTEQEGSRGGNKQHGQQNREEKEKGLFEKMMAQTTEKENGKV